MNKLLLFFLLILGLTSCGGGGSIENSCTNTIQASFVTDTMYGELLAKENFEIAKLVVQAYTNIEIDTFRLSLFGYQSLAGPKDMKVKLKLLAIDDELSDTTNIANGKIIFGVKTVSIAPRESRTFSILADLRDFQKNDAITISIQKNDLWTVNCGNRKNISPLTKGSIYATTYIKTK